MKKVISFMIIAAVIIGCILAAGCTNTQTPATSEVPKDVAYTVTVTKEGPGSYNIGDILAISLPSNSGSTGYDWQVIDGKDVLYNSFNNAEEVAAANPGMVGVPITQTFWFQMKEEGIVPITLKYCRAWEKDATDATVVSGAVAVVKSDNPNANGPKAQYVYDSFNLNPAAGSYVKIVTTGNPTTGYDYTTTGEGLTIVEDYVVADPSLAGSSGTYNWYVKADKAGDYTFTATLKKAGSDEVISYFTVPLKFV